MAGVLIGLGNPLLDISANVDQALLDKYELKNADQILAEDKHLPLYDELAAKSDVQYIAGGATQNTVRVAQWMLGDAGATSYAGCVGKDKYAEKMRSVCAEGGVAALYLEDEGTPTGTCAVCILNKDRSLVANLAAANNYKAEHMQQPEVAKALEAAKVVYSAGFFITACAPAIEACAKHCTEKGKTYAINLSAPFIMEVPPFKATLLTAMKAASFVFGNETEAATFAKSEGWETTDVTEIATKMSGMGGADLTVVITQGADATVVAKGGKSEKFEVPPVPAAEIVDTNGAGDAFVGGFLAAFIRGKDTAACCKAGNYAASVIIKTSGTALPATCDHKL